jgi:hypothetical protein
MQSSSSMTGQMTLQFNPADVLVLASGVQGLHGQVQTPCERHIAVANCKRVVWRAAHNAAALDACDWWMIHQC